MPELPDVAVFKKYFDSTALHQPIERTRVGDTAVLTDVSARKIQRRLKGRPFTSTRRHGKHLFAHAGEGDWLRLHFGMTGFLAYAGQAKALPDHTRVSVDFAGGYRLAYVCSRKFGEVGLVSDPGVFVEERELGPDALDLDFEGFRARLEGRRGAVKSTLMNQKVLAGLGNIYTDEVLFQAGLHPETKVRDLEADALRSVFQSMQDVLETAIARRADPEKLPDTYLLSHRRGDGCCPRCGGELKRIKVSGRTTYFCPTCQERP